MRCSKCQTENKETAKFCRGCGLSLAVAETGAVETNKVCDQCHHACKPEAKFCLQCGHPFQTAAAEPAEVMASDDVKSCPGCSNTLKLNAKFCGKCGFNFAEVAQETAQATLDSPADSAVEIVVPVQSHESVVAIEPVAAIALPATAAVAVETVESVQTVTPVERLPENNESMQPVAENPAAANRSAARAQGAGSSPVTTHEAKKGSNAVLMGSILGCVLIIAAGGYWWLKVRHSDTSVVAVTATTVPEKTEPASSVPVTVVASAPVEAPVAASAPSMAPVVEEKAAAPKIEPAPKSAAAARQSETVKETKREKAPASMKKDVSEKPAHAAPVATVHEVPPVPQPVVPDVPLDPQSESMLAMADKMYANKSYSSVLDLARPVLKKYPANAHANRLINNSRAAIDRQQEELLGKLKELGK